MKMIDLMNSIKTRPEIYLGERSFTRLISFIRGYEYCQSKYISESSILTSFDEFVHHRYDLPDLISNDLEKDILLFSGFDEDQAFDNFFKLYENWKLKEEVDQELTRHTLSQVLKEIKCDPKKFFKSKSFNKLMPFIYGYEICEYNFDENYQKFPWNELFIYLANKYHIDDKLTLNVEQIVKYISENDLEAFDLFFEEYERFLSLEK